MQEDFSLINWYSFRGAGHNESIEIIDGVSLKRPDEYQYCVITNELDYYSSNMNLSRYGVDIDENGRHWKEIPSEERNFSIIELSDFSRTNSLTYALCLSKLDLTVLFDATYVGGEVNKDPRIEENLLILTSYLFDNSENYHKKTISEMHIDNIQRIFNLLIKFNSLKFLSIHKIIEDFYNLKELSITSPFKVIGLFSLLESLIVNTDRYNENTITNQLKSKLNLLNNRFSEKVNIFDYFKDPDTPSVPT